MARPDRVRAAGVAALICAATVGLSAHRRDEPLQAARIGVERDRVDVELDITPGIDVAGAFVAAIDGDHDGVLSEPERDTFARHAIGDLAFAIDLEAHALHLRSARFPDVASLRRGEGTIRLQSRATFTEQDAGAHHLRFVNATGLSQSAYLANALVPDSRRVTVTAQHRSVDQRDITIDYTVADDGGGAWFAPLVVAIAAGLLALALGPRLVASRARSPRA
jgi:hypothetical protein